MQTRMFLFFSMMFFSHGIFALSTQYDADNSNWLVETKQCNGQNQTLNGIEKVYFRNTFFMQSYRQSADEEKTCYQIVGFYRSIQSSSSSSDRYEEISTLIPNVLRTQCRSKATGDIISDNTVSISGPTQSLNVVLQASGGNVDISGSNFCKIGILHLNIKNLQAPDRKRGVR